MLPDFELYYKTTLNKTHIAGIEIDLQTNGTEGRAQNFKVETEITERRF